jgi:hypothetical protein
MSDHISSSQIIVANRYGNNSDQHNLARDAMKITDSFNYDNMIKEKPDSAIHISNYHVDYIKGTLTFNLHDIYQIDNVKNSDSASTTTESRTNVDNTATVATNKDDL